MPDTENRSIDPERIDAVAHAVHVLCHGRSDISLAAHVAAAVAQHLADAAPMTDSSDADFLAERAALEAAVTKRARRSRTPSTRHRRNLFLPATHPHGFQDGIDRLRQR